MESDEIRDLAIELLRKTSEVEECFWFFANEWVALYKALGVTADELESVFPIDDKK